MRLRAKTRPFPLFKVCAICKETKPFLDFHACAYVTNQGKDSRRLSGRCKSCIAVARHNRYANKSEAQREVEREKCRAWKRANPNRFNLRGQVIEKTCGKCGKVKQASDFYRKGKNRDGLHSYCKACHKGDVADYQKRNPGRKHSSSFVVGIKSKYGLTLERYREMQQAQKSLCALCGRMPDKGLCVDHCHRSNRVRALLCFNCNVALGAIHDDIALAKRIVDYLTIHGANGT